jgi:outer membrane protein
MSRRCPLVLALALALPFGASAADLLQTYELARSGDPQLSIAESGRLFDKEGATQALGALLPQVSADASLRRSKSKPEGGSWTDSSTSRSYGLVVSQTLFDWSRIANLQGQKALSTAADYDLDAANHNLITRTSAIYFNVLVGIESLAAAETNEAASLKQFDYAQKRLDVGLAPITDVHEARAQYDSARASTILARNALDDAYRALAELTGQPVVNLRGLPDDFRPELPVERDGEAWITNALQQNPSLKAQEYQVQSAEYGVSSARAGHYPTLSLSGSYGRDAAWGNSITGGQAFDGDSRSVGVTLSVPIFSGGITQSRVRQALASRDIAQDQYEQQRRALIRNTSNAYQALVAGVSEVEARRLAVVSAQSAYDASQVGLEVGTRTVLDVLQNQRTLFAAQVEYASAKYNYLQNRLLLEQAAGSLDINDVQDINRLLTVDAEARLAPEPTARR